MTEDEKKQEIEKLKSYYKKDNLDKKEILYDESKNTNLNVEKNIVDDPNQEKQKTNNEKSFLSTLPEEKKINITNTEDSKKTIKNENESKSLFAYIKVITLFLLSIIFLTYIIDQYIMPALVHSRPVLAVPNIEGLSLDSAENILVEKKLSYKIVKKQFDPRLKKDHVIMQKPIEGSIVKESRPVYLTISQGSEKINVPYLKGISIRQARVKLQNQGLLLGKIDYEFNEEIPRNSVISQSIKQGINLEIGDKIDIVVSMGSENLSKVPNLLFLDYREIDYIIEDSGFKKGSYTWIEDETFEHGTIIEQFPMPDQLFDRNTYIDLIIAKHIIDINDSITN